MASADAATPLRHDTDIRALWNRLRLEAASVGAEDPMLAGLVNAGILRHGSFAEALAHRIALKLADGQLDAMLVHDVVSEALRADPAIVFSAAADMLAVDERDPACRSLLQPFFYFKGFQALQAYRVAHWLWGQGREALAFHFGAG